MVPICSLRRPPKSRFVNLRTEFLRMRYPKIIATILMLPLAGISQLFAQEKVEVERRINKSKVPEDAVEWLNETFDKPRRVKWYFEDNAGDKGFEGKFTRKGHLHSVEFNEEGEIEDVEVKMEWSELPGEVREELQEYFSENYISYNIRRIQRQFSGESDDLQEAFEEDDELDDIEIRYEIEFYGRSDEDDELWEGLFDDEGELIERTVIKLRPTDNLNY